MRLVVGFKANCSLVGPGPIDGMPSVGIFLRTIMKIWSNPFCLRNESKFCDDSAHVQETLKNDVLNHLMHLCRAYIQYNEIQFLPLHLVLYVAVTFRHSCLPVYA